MWRVRKLLARIGLRQVADLRYSDDRLREGVIVDESRTRYCVEAMITLGAFYRRRVRTWVAKGDPAITLVRWSNRSRHAFAATTVLALLVASVVCWPGMTKEQRYLTLEDGTIVPLIGTVAYPNVLPKGHYTLSRTGSSDEAIVVLHDYGPWRDFAYIVMHRKLAGIPPDAKEGDTFTL